MKSLQHPLLIVFALCSMQAPQAIADVTLQQNVTVSASGMAAIMLVSQALVDAGDNVLIIGPLWPNCAGTVEVMGGTPCRKRISSFTRGTSRSCQRISAPMSS